MFDSIFWPKFVQGRAQLLEASMNNFPRVKLDALGLGHTIGRISNEYLDISNTENIVVVR